MKVIMRYLGFRAREFPHYLNLGSYRNNAARQSLEDLKKLPHFDEFDLYSKVSVGNGTYSPSTLLAKLDRKIMSFSPFSLYKTFLVESLIMSEYERWIQDFEKIKICDRIISDYVSMMKRPTKNIETETEISSVK